MHTVGTGRVEAYSLGLAESDIRYYLIIVCLELVISNTLDRL